MEATCEAVQASGITRAGLFGTRFTMQGDFYSKVFTMHGITILAPGPLLGVIAMLRLRGLPEAVKIAHGRR